MKYSKILDGHDKRLRKEKWIGVIIHHTGIGKRNNADKSLWERLHKNIALYLAKKDNTYVSAHFQIGRYGEVTMIVDPDKYVAYHAGKSSFWHPEKRKLVNGCNDYFIGIELLGDGNKLDYSDEQYKSLSELLRYLIKRYQNIQPHCITGHEVVSPGRKDDPGIYFDWKKLFRLVFSEN